MATKPAVAARARKVNQKHGSSELLSKLKFIWQVQKKEPSKNGSSYETHCVIQNQTISATDGTFSIGATINEDIEVCPHTYSLIQALENCGATVGVVMDEKGISVVSDKFKVKVAHMPRGSIPIAQPDRILVPINDQIKEAFAVVSPLAKEGDLRMCFATVLLEANIVSATNGYAVMQYRHGIDLPPMMAIPKRFCDFVVKHPAELMGFGWTKDKSITFWFEDGTWVKTALQLGSWPNVDLLFAHNANYWALPEGFAEAVTAVSKFSENSMVQFGDGVITSDKHGKTLASYDVEGMKAGLMYNGKTLVSILPYMQKADFNSKPDCVMFTGCDNNMRGIIMGVRG